MVPHWESFAHVSSSNAGPENRKVWSRGETSAVLPDGVNDDQIVHHDDDPGQAAEDEDHGDHDEHQGESLLAFTEVTDTSHKQVFVNGWSGW